MKITIEEIISNKVLALSWKEPYGSLMLHGKIETRTWKTNYRGLVLICCSKVAYAEHQLMNISGIAGAQRILNLLNERGITEQPGKAIAVSRLIDCRPMKFDDEGKTFVKFYSDLYCHVYEDVTPIQPFPWKGKQGWSTVSEEDKKKIIFKLK